MAASSTDDIPTQLAALLGREVLQIRKTNENPPRVSIIDVTMAVSGGSQHDAARTLRRTRVDVCDHTARHRSHPRSSVLHSAGIAALPTSFPVWLPDGSRFISARDVTRTSSPSRDSANPTGPPMARRHAAKPFSVKVATCSPAAFCISTMHIYMDLHLCARS